MKHNYRERIALKFSPGFTLVEVIVAVTIFSVGVITSLGLITFSIANISSHISRITAVNLAEEGIEMVRNVRDSNWLASGDPNDWDIGISGIGSEKAIKFFCGGAANQNTNETNIDSCGSSCQIYVYRNTVNNFLCYSDNFGVQAGYSIEKQTGFYRLITLDSVNAFPGPMKPIEVKVYVKWLERGGQYRYLTIQEILYNWKN